MYATYTQYSHLPSDVETNTIRERREFQKRIVIVVYPEDSIIYDEPFSLNLTLLVRDNSTWILRRRRKGALGTLRSKRRNGWRDKGQMEKDTEGYRQTEKTDMAVGEHTNSSTWHRAFVSLLCLSRKKLIFILPAISPPR